MSDLAQKVIETEIQGIQELATLCQDKWDTCAEMLFSTKGKVVICGLGKSGHIGKKWAASFSSLGLSSFFLHATEALHGDLGMLRPGDLLMVISNSGSTQEVVAVAAYAKSEKIPVVAITKNANSSLVENSDFHLPLPAIEEADPNGLAPTTSTTATLVMGDVLAVLVSEKLNFKKEDFGKVHPGGALGKVTQQGVG